MKRSGDTKVLAILHSGLRTSLQIGQPLLISLALLLIGLVAFSYFAILLPLLELSPGVYYLVSGIGLYFIANIVFNYLMAIFVPPGVTKHLFSITDCPDQLSNEGRDHMGIRRWCPKCSRTKPDRSHHCSFCNSCILKYDHHCPWIGQCVGLGNYKFFYLFLFYLFLGTLWVCVLVFPLLIRPGRTLSSVLLLFILCIAIFIAMVLLGGFQTMLLFTNRTTVEFYEEQPSHRHTYFLTNIRKVFGHHHNWWSWVLPSTSTSPYYQDSFV